VSPEEILAAWNRPEALSALHPTRGISEDAYWASGTAQAALLAQDIPAGGRVMDFGCGDGRVAIPLRALGFDVTAVDASPRMLAAVAGNDPDLTAVQSDGSDLASHLGRRKMDAVVCLAVLIHHGYEAGERIVEQLRAVVKKGGLLFLDWPVSSRPAEGVAWLDVTMWSQARQDAIVERLGLTPVEGDRPWQVFRA
jgi:2-polyprenyl-3-methyl-5-hydroxy-6-metoxy-1,4-benzoquinol methylase